PSFTWAGRSGDGMYSIASTQVGIALGALPEVMFYQNGENIRSDGLYGWSSTTDPTGAADTTIARSAAGTISVNGAKITAGSGTGITVNNIGAQMDQTSKVRAAGAGVHWAAVTCES